MAKIVRERDVKEHVEELRAKFYGALEDVLIAVLQYVKNGKDGGWLGYEMLRDAGMIPQRDAKNNPVVETRKPVSPDPDGEQDRMTMIAKEMARRTMERHRFFTTPLPERDESWSSNDTLADGNNRK